MPKTAAQLEREIAEVLHNPRRLAVASRAVDKLLQRMKVQQDRHAKASEELREAARQSDNVDRDEEGGHPVEATRKKAAARRWSRAVRAEQSLTNKMRDLVLKIRAIDPKRVPWGWQNTR